MRPIRTWTWIVYGVVAGLLLAVSTAGWAATLRVTTSGTGGTYTSIQAAIDAATDGDEIYVAQGTYAEKIVITKSLKVYGGWDADFTVRDITANETTIDAQRTGCVVRVAAGPAVIIDGFGITGGDGTAGVDTLGWGGGIRIGESFDNTGSTTVANCRIYDNLASNTSSGQGEGGGIHVYNNTALIVNNRIHNNIAQTYAGKGGRGGGIFAGWSANVTIVRSEITTNTAAMSPAGGWNGEGGGVCLDAIDTYLEGNTISGNVAAVEGPGEGGGVWAMDDVIGNLIENNTASVNGDGLGGGVYANWVHEFFNNVVQNNVASRTGNGTGGGIYGNQLQIARDNTIAGNEAHRGGGVYLRSYARAELRRNLIANNQATGSSTTTQDGGGGIASQDNEAQIIENQILDNVAELSGGGLYLFGGTNPVVKGNTIERNQAPFGGGVMVQATGGAVTENRVAANESLVGGGLYLSGTPAPVLNRNTILNNSATGFFGYSGGGMVVDVEAALRVTITNHLLVGNQTGGGGTTAGVLVTRGTVDLFNCTLVDNTGTNSHGVGLASPDGPQRLLNTIVVGHLTGIYAASGVSSFSDYNDYFDNTTNVTGLSLGTHDRTDDPLFINRSTGNYHLGFTSPLVDKGTSTVSVPEDFEGDPRPHGPGIDIGADEAYRTLIYVSDQHGNDTTGSGSGLLPYKTIKKGLAETQVGGSVLVEQGTYTGMIDIQRSVNLLGGYLYSSRFPYIWPRNIDQYVTTLTASGAGSTVSIHGENVTALVEGFTITGGDALTDYTGGGVVVTDEASATIRSNRITGNHAPLAGGGIAVSNSSGRECVVERNRIYDNHADGEFPAPPRPGIPGRSLRLAQGPFPGGGLLVFGGPTTVRNNFLSNNSSPVGGDGAAALSDRDGAVNIYNNTFVDNGTATGEGLHLLGNTTAQFEIHNNWFVGHHVGLKSVAAVPPDADYNGFVENDVNLEGVGESPRNVIGNPRFLDRANGNFHIRQNSAGLDAGDPARYSLRDIDTDTCPIGSGPDIGADENAVFLTAAEIIDHLLGRAALAAGRALYADLNEDGEVNASDLTLLLSLP